MSYLGLGMELALPLVLFLYLGHRLDLWLDTEPWLMVAGALLGIVVGFWSVYRSLLKTTERRNG
jgi:F0F1-type ATP synthase assembly protein I